MQVAVGTNLACPEFISNVGLEKMLAFFLDPCAWHAAVAFSAQCKLPLTENCVYVHVTDLDQFCEELMNGVCLHVVHEEVYMAYGFEFVVVVVDWSMKLRHV